MHMALTQNAALWFLPLVLPMCLYAMYSDLRWMKIYNINVCLILAVFLFAGPFALGLETYLWRFVALAVAFAVLLALWAAGAMGAGDAKFIIAMAPMIDWHDYRIMVALYCAWTLAAVLTHRIAGKTALRSLAPDWESWSMQARKFPMAIALAPIFLSYLILGWIYGA